MKITRVTVRYGRTANLGNYESAKIECELEAELEPDEVAAAVRLQLFAEAKAAVREQLTPLARLRIAQIEEIIGTLPADLQLAVRKSLNTAPVPTPVGTGVGSVDGKPVARARS